MTTLDIVELIFVIAVVAVGVGGFIYALRKED